MRVLEIRRQQVVEVVAIAAADDERAMSLDAVDATDDGDTGPGMGGQLFGECPPVCRVCSGLIAEADQPRQINGIEQRRRADQTNLP
ncbi:MAG: hypothetical protein DYH20_11125 [Gammaproteobacteria bacterium PRO9]|nr:hypothetical protein [Gammaproteobacteria bacterium PRO9]